MKKIFRNKKASTTTEEVKILEELTEKQQTNNNCTDGEHCQKIVSEAELGQC